jgi:hypothetical protein
VEGRQHAFATQVSFSLPDEVLTFRMRPVPVDLCMGTVVIGSLCPDAFLPDACYKGKIPSHRSVSSDTAVSWPWVAEADLTRREEALVRGKVY